MKNLLIALFFISSFSLKAEVSPVATGDAIQAAKINELIAKINTMDAFKLGDVKTSVLTEANFQTQHGDCWVLMDGRNIAGKDLAVLSGVASIPDGRGVFIRGKNNGKTGTTTNPDGDSALGLYQDDMYKHHTHIQNEHAHSIVGYTRNGAVGSAVIVEGYNAGYAAKVAALGYAVGTTATNQESGGNETRVKNITMNYFIKISNACN